MTELTDADVQSQQVGLYWITGGTNVVVTADVTLLGISFHRTAKFEVLRPEASFGVKEPLGSVQCSYSCLEFGSDRCRD